MKGSSHDRQASQKGRLRAILEQREREKAAEQAEYLRKYRPTEYAALYGSSAGIGPDFSDYFLKPKSESSPKPPQPPTASNAKPSSANSNSSSAMPNSNSNNKSSNNNSKNADKGKSKQVTDEEAAKRAKEEEDRMFEEMERKREMEDLTRKKILAREIAETIARIKQEQVMSSLQRFKEEQARKNTAVMKAEYEQYKVVSRALGYHGNGLGQGSKAIASTFHSKEMVAYNAARHAIVHHFGAGGGGSHYHMASTKAYLKGERTKGMTQRHSRQNDVRQGAKRKAQNMVNGAHNKSSGSMAILM